MKSSTRGNLARLGIAALLAFQNPLVCPARADEPMNLSFSQPLSVDASRAESLGTSLRIAARRGQVLDMEKLIASHADVNQPSQYGETALMYAAQYNRVRAAQLLIRSGATVDDSSTADITALHLAAKYCAPEISAMLLEAGAAVNRRSQEGRTPLIYAAQFGCGPVVAEILRTPDADVNQKDFDGKTALDYAIEAAQEEVGGPATDALALLKAAGGVTAMHAMPALSGTPRSASKLKSLP